MTTTRCNIPPIDTDDLIIRTIAALIRQGVPSTCKSVAGACAYRGENGTACAVGMWINDGDYRKKFEGVSSEHLREFYPKALPDFIQDSHYVMSLLQTIHDTVSDSLESNFIVALRTKFFERIHGQERAERLWGLAMEFSADGAL